MWRAWVIVLLLPTTALAAPRRIALIVANNRAPDAQSKPLTYADDDGAKYYELFTALGAEVHFLALLDPETQREFPEAARAAKPPTRAALLDAVSEIFASIDRAQESHFYFVFAGHGTLGPNREGSLTLLDGGLSRADLYGDILSRSPATWNHLILDACNAYFVVEKRGGGSYDAGEAVRQFLTTEDIDSYPNTGVILAASGEAETHEWSRWRSGVFSHELRSALLGGADVDGDGKVTYAEAAAAIEAANSAVTDPRGRLRVHARPPRALVDLPLVDLRDLPAAVPRLSLDSIRGRYYVEDARGVRVLDLHASGEGPLRVTLVGEAPFRLRNDTLEAEVPAGALSATELHFVPIDAQSRGLDASFRTQLYALPFGKSFFAGAMATRGPGVPGWDGWYGSPPALDAQAPARLAPWAFASAGVAVGSAALGGVFALMAREAHRDYAAATERDEALRLKARTRDRALTANVLWATAGVAAVGAVLLYVGDAP